MDDLTGILRELVDGLGARVAALGSTDGLVVEQYPRDRCDLSTTAAELTNVLVGVRRALSEALDVGDARELVIGTDGATAYVRVLARELYLVVVMEAGADPAPARAKSATAAEHVLALVG
jgi:predicted regulator of Ras-like GTPase activity (Roadblock/LC7/MglB family)